jgi:predicted acyl esterase
VVVPELFLSWIPKLSFGGTEPIPQGEVVQLQIALWRTGIIFEKGESLILKVSGHDMRLADFERPRGNFEVVNEEKHYVHFGGRYENYRIMLSFLSREHHIIEG